MWLQELERNRELKMEFSDPSLKIHFLPCSVILRDSIENWDHSVPFLAMILDQEQTIRFPVIIKSNSASSKKYSHHFKIVENPEDLFSEVQKAFEIYHEDDRLLVQSYIDQSRYVVKCYATSTSHYLKIQENLTADEKIEVSNSFMKFKDYKKSNLKGGNWKQSVIPVQVRQKIGKMSEFLTRKSGMEIMSLDFLVNLQGESEASETQTLELLVIDFNYFTGFGTKSFCKQFRNLM